MNSHIHLTRKENACLILSTRKNEFVKSEVNFRLPRTKRTQSKRPSTRVDIRHFHFERFNVIIVIEKN